MPVKQSWVEYNEGARLDIENEKYNVVRGNQRGRWRDKNGRDKKGGGGGGLHR